MPRGNGTYILYRIYDDSGALLYIGQTIQGFKKRLAQHRKEKRAWVDRMAKVKLRYYQGPWALALAEPRAISVLEPKFNVQESREYHRRKLEYERLNCPMFHLRHRGEGMWMIQELKGRDEVFIAAKQRRGQPYPGLEES